MDGNAVGRRDTHAGVTLSRGGCGDAADEDAFEIGQPSKAGSCIVGLRGSLERPDADEIQRALRSLDGDLERWESGLRQPLDHGQRSILARKGANLYDPRILGLGRWNESG